MAMPESLDILYLDDEESNLDGLYYAFMDEFKIHIANTPDKAFQILEQESIKIIIADQRMPVMSGYEFIKKVKDGGHPAVCIMLTAYSDFDVVVDSINTLKIFGFVQKPFNINALRQLLLSGFETYYLKDKNQRLINELQEKNTELTRLQKELEVENIILKEQVDFKRSVDFVTEDQQMKQLLEKVNMVSKVDAPVLIEGETGTGKELIARFIHENSERKDKPLVVLNCASLPETLIESELFGYEKGAFTGADQMKPGRFELADKGTLFLDEIGEIPMHLQAKLLRAIQQGQFERLGGTQTLKTDVRIISATNRDLKQQVADLKFRDDLFYRINVFHFMLPALRERIDDIPALVQFFLDKYNSKYNKSISLIPKKTLQVLCAYSWPGNIRELENVMERAVITSVSNKLEVDMLRDLSRNDQSNELLKFRDVEKGHILKVLNRTNWRIRGIGGAADLLDLKPTTLYSKMKKLDIIKEEP